MEAMTQKTAPTKSGPAWQSIMSGVEPLKHFVFTNDGAKHMPNRYYKSFLWYARNNYGLKTMAAVNINEEHVQNFLEADAIDYVQNIKDVESVGDDVNIDTVEYELGVNDYGIIFLHLDEVDETGHRISRRGEDFSFDLQEYLDAIEIVDGQIKRVIDAID